MTTAPRGAARWLRGLDASLDRLVDATPGERERTVDFLRALAISVVAVWHWSLSVTHRDSDGRLVMPNPIHEVPLGWLATWLLQVMPVFFVVGGFANLASWDAVRRAGGDWRTFHRQRARRLLAPVAVFLVVWAGIDAVGHAVIDGYRSVVIWGQINFVPLWFVAAYVGVVALVPLTARLHRRRPRATLVALGGAMVAADVARFALELGIGAWVNTAIVWVFVHQLGYFYRDGAVLAWPVWARLGVALAALATLAVLTALGTYPRSMVAVQGEGISHLYPTTGVVAVLAVFQTGVVASLRPWLERLLERRAVWKAVVAVNAVIMTVFLWHMTALLAAVGAYEALGFELAGEATASWWLQRPLWILGPLVALAGLVAVFHRMETGVRRRAQANSARTGA